MHEDGVELQLAAEVDRVVALRGTRRPQRARAQQHRGGRGPRGRATVGQADGPRRHADREEPGEDAALLGELAALARDRPGPPAGLVEGGGLAEQVGEPYLPPGQQLGHAAGVRRREVEGARRQVAVPQQRVAPTEVHEVTGPRGARGRDAGETRVALGDRPRGSARGDALDGRGLAARRGRVGHLCRLTTRPGTRREGAGRGGAPASSAGPRIRAGRVAALRRARAVGGWRRGPRRAR